MNIKHSLLLAVTSLSTMTALSAQDKLEVKVTGRALFDAATYSQNDAAKKLDGTMNDGIGFRDMRIGFKAYYGQNWYFRGDASFTANKVSLKDVYLQYSFSKNNFLRAGHYIIRKTKRAAHRKRSVHPHTPLRRNEALHFRGIYQGRSATIRTPFLHQSNRVGSSSLT